MVSLRSTFMKRLVFIVATLFIEVSVCLVAKSQEDGYLQLGVSGGLSSPTGSYSKPQASARKGFMTGIFTDYYFMRSNFGIGIDARLINHPHESPDTIYFNNGYTANTYSSPKRFRHFSLTLGPVYRFSGSKIGVELYAKGGILFQQFPIFANATVKPPVTPGGKIQTTYHSRTTVDNAKAWTVLTGVRFNYSIVPKLNVFLFGDYQTTVGKQFFGKPSQFAVRDIPISQTSDNTYIGTKMFNIGTGIKFILGEVRNPGLLNRNL